MVMWALYHQPGFMIFCSFCEIELFEVLGLFLYESDELPIAGPRVVLWLCSEQGPFG